MKKIVSAFPGCGKSYIYNNPDKFNLTQMTVEDGGSKLQLVDPRAFIFGNPTPVFDSDSSLFNEKDFPENYVNYIKRVRDEYQYSHLVFVSSHKDVRQLLQDNGVEFTLVYPDRSLKDEYLNRYRERGSDFAFQELLVNNWDKWITSCDNDPTSNKLILQTGQSLSDVLFNQ
jgi:hypothetical protein